jgi:hypothetical protein
MMVLQTGFVYAGRGLSPALYEYNEQAATTRTPAQKKDRRADVIRAACVPESVCALSQCGRCWGGVLDAHL